MKNKQFFYAIVREGKFINANYDKEDTSNISDALVFFDETSLLNYWDSSSVKKMREIFDMKVVEVECILREYI